MANEAASQAADARRRKLDALFAEQPYMSATMKAFNLQDTDGALGARYSGPPIGPAYDDGNTARIMQERRSALASCPMPSLAVEPPDPKPGRRVAVVHGTQTVDCRDGVVHLDLLLDSRTVPASVRVSHIAADVMTLTEAATYLRFAPSTLRSWVRRGKVPCARVGRSLRFRRVALDEWLKSRE